MCKHRLEVLQKPFDNQISVKHNIRAGNQQKKTFHCPLIGELVIHSACVTHGRECSAPVYLQQKNPVVRSWDPPGPNSVLPRSDDHSVLRRCGIC